jgi:carbonic anhydrase
MKKLMRGLREFRSNYFYSHQELFEQLSQGQRPRVLFITCSDSRIDPNLITQSEMGELFVIRNAGNIIPPYGAANGGEGAAVEYAIQALDIQQVVICGHSHCGAMKGLLHLNQLQADMPLVYDWLKHAEATRRLVLDNYHSVDDEQLLEIAVAENVLTQIENLKTYPVVHSRLYQRKLQIYGWIYLIETGEILAYDPVHHGYVAPQSQIAEAVDGDEEDLVQAVVSPSAPPIMCEIPPRRLPHQSVAKHENSSSQKAEFTPWVSPEQADRIYRGSP